MPVLPQIVQRSSAVTTIPVVDSARSPVGAAVSDFGQAASNTVDIFRKARATTMINEARVALANGFADLEIQSLKDPWATKSDLFEQRAKQLKDDTYSLVKDEPLAAKAYDEIYTDFYLPKKIGVKRDAWKGEVDHNVAVLQQATADMSQQWATANDPVTKKAIEKQYGDLVASNIAAGFIDETDGGKFARAFQSNNAEFEYRRLIRTNPQAAEAKLAEGLDPRLTPEANERLLNQATHMVDRENSNYDRSLRLQEHAERVREKQLNDQMDELVYKKDIPGLTEFVTKNFTDLSSPDRRFAQQLIEAGPDHSDQTVYNELKYRASHGEDVRDEARAASTRGLLSHGDYNSLVEDAARVSPEPWYRQGKDYIDGQFKQGALTFDPEVQKHAADAQDEWADWARDHPDATEEDAKKAQRQIVANYKIDASPEPSRLPSYAVGDRTTLDIDKSAQRTTEAFLAKHNGNEAAMDADPDYLREMANLKQWSDYIEVLKQQQEQQKAP